MSHTHIVVSPADTPLAFRTVGELVAERPGRSRIFQSFQIDFCCQGGRTLTEACQRKGVSLESVIEQIEAEQVAVVESGENPAQLPPAELISYIVEKHHSFLRRELPRLHAMAHRVAQVHGPHTPSLLQVSDVFTGLFQELDSHMMKEEQILFPAILAMNQSGEAMLPLDGPIACMIHEHDDAGEALRRLRELTHGYQPPADACNTYRALFDGLKDLEEDLHRHIHLENSVLFPAAEQMAAL
ncbi:MAG: iron-sulfur cluster repair di-iron protein [Verrucomicrobia bacterium]|nr:iron-sulfur cluster repair di-iron protein [Verrucomicrobiota bacterium]